MDNKIAIEYKNCIYHTIESQNTNTTLNSGRTYGLNHFTPGIEVNNHNRLDLVSKGQVSERASTSK